MLLAFLYPALIFCASNWLSPEVFTFHRAHLFRPAYLIVLGYLIGYLGEHERRSKRKLRFMLDLSTASRRDRVSALDLVRLIRRVLAYFDAPRALVVLRDPDSTRYFTWDVSRGNGIVRLGLRISEDDPLPLPFASSTEALLVNSLQPGSGTALCYDVFSGAMQRKAIRPDLRFPGDAQPQTLVVAPIIVQRDLRGRVVVLRDSRPNFTRDDLEFLLVVVGQAAASLEAARLQEKAEEVAVLEERARIARDLHDGFIQSLAGIDLRVEACRVMCERDPSRISTELADLQQVVDRGYRDVRAYLKVLRGASRRSRDLEAVLDRIAAEFSMRDRLQVRLTLPPADPGWSEATTHEIGQIVREALQNAVRHGQATKAVVKLRAYDSHCTLFIRDNGRGFPNGSGRGLRADGSVPPSAVPWSIRERAAALGAALRVRSRPGNGAEIVLRVPITNDEGGDQEPRPIRRQM
jgi:signal transduction histidine kinase